MRFLTFILLLLSVKSFAQSFHEATSHLLSETEGRMSVIDSTFSLDFPHWAKLTCYGPVTQKGKSIKVEKLMTFYSPLTGTSQFPTIKAIQNKNHDLFRKISKYCTEERLSRFENPVNWLGWGTDWEYTRLEVDLTIVEPNLCRDLGGPCLNDTQCCVLPTTGPRQQLSCDKVTNSCLPKKQISINTQFDLTKKGPL